MYDVKTFQGQPARFSISSKLSLTGYTFNLQTSTVESFTTPLFRGTASLVGNTVIVTFTAAEVNELQDSYFRIEAVKSGSPTFFLAKGRLQYTPTLAEVTSGMIDSDGYLIEPYVQGLLQNTRLVTTDDLDPVVANIANNYRKWLGVGTTYPVAAIDGDYMYRSDLLSTMLRSNGAWKQVEYGAVANSTARLAIPTTAIHAGFQVRQTDFNVVFEWTGTEWMPITPVLGKMWRTGAGLAMTLATFMLIPMGASRVMGGFVFDATNSRLQIPYDGYYRITNAHYTTGSDGQIMYLITRQRASVADLDVGAVNMVRKTGSDQQDSVVGVYPLKAGDYLIQRGYAYSTGMQAYGASEISSNQVVVEYVAPLNGAVPA